MEEIIKNANLGEAGERPRPLDAFDIEVPFVETPKGSVRLLKETAVGKAPLVSSLPVLPLHRAAPCARAALGEDFLDLGSSSCGPLDWAQKWWARSPPTSLYTVEQSVPQRELRLVRNVRTGLVEDIKEAPCPHAGETASNSTSLHRRPGLAEDFVRGNAQQLPFRPGGLESRETEDSLKSSNDNFKDDPFNPDAGLLNAAPGLKPVKFSEGVAMEWNILPDDSAANTAMTKNRANEGLVAVDSLLEGTDEDLADIAQEPQQDENVMPGENKNDEGEPKNDEIDELGSQLDEMLMGTMEGFTRHQRAGAKPGEGTTWAVMERLDVSLFSEMVPEPAIDYPFDLDTFQKEAIVHIENNECVFVTAHTSAGKTVVAEYAIAVCAKHMTRAVYTSPIKTLSNQKYRDFKKTFGDVGLITGDVSINPAASCLIMTTEILRNMLYKGADLVRDIEWVIFDEVHYINDIERGVVWEEVIIMLPDHVNIILLSATVPNHFEFADWVGRIKKKRVYVVGTQKRPVPLEHYLFAGGDMHKLMDARGSFLQAGHKSAVAAVEKPDKKSGSGGSGTGSGRGGRGGGRSGQGPVKTGHQMARAEITQWNKVIDYLRKRQLLPVIVFSFSKKKCEECAEGLSNVDLTDHGQKSEIQVFLDQSFGRLKGSDRQLPQILRLSGLLKRGVGVHHAGMLPIVKECVEMLFQRGLVKILFATETFAMGVNMPAKTVFYSSLRKHDGVQFRDLLSGEYTQMSGRAGRRGLDSVGLVCIMCANEVPEQHTLHQILTGPPLKLRSQFRLTYSMIVNLLRVEDFRVEDMIKRSFAETGTQRVAPEQKELLEKGEASLKEMDDLTCLFGEPAIEDYYVASQQLEHLNRTMQKFILNSPVSSSYLSPGRVLVVNARNRINDIAVIMKVSSPISSRSHFSGEALKTYTVCVLHRDGEKIDSSNVIGGVAYEIMDIAMAEITIICKQTIVVEPGLDHSNEADRGKLGTIVQKLGRLKSQYGSEGPPPLHPINDMKIRDIDFADAYHEKAETYEYLKKSKCHNCPKLQSQYAEAQKRVNMKQRVDKLKHALSEENLELIPEFTTRLAVLQKLNFISDDRTVQLKGRVACETNTADELILTELIFENHLTDLNIEECAALLSAFVFQQKNADEPQLTEKLSKARDKLVELAKYLAEVQQDCGLDITVEEYLKNLNFNLMEVVYEWAKGTPFADICQLTNVEEGTIVRTIVRLDETCRDVRNGARVIGDPALFQKMEEASQAVRRDIVFTASLYVT